MILLKKSSFSEQEQCEKKARLNFTYGERGEEKAMKEKHGNHRKRLNPLMLVIHVQATHQGSFLDRQETGSKQALLKNKHHTKIHF